MNKKLNIKGEFEKLGYEIADSIIYDINNIDLYLDKMSEIMTDKDVLAPILKRLYSKNKKLMVLTADKIIVRINEKIVINAFFNSIFYSYKFNSYVIEEYMRESTLDLINDKAFMSYYLSMLDLFPHKKSIKNIYYKLKTYFKMPVKA